MSSIHFKFRSDAEFEALFFDGHSLSLKELREAIIAKKKMGKASDFKLEVMNTATNREYEEDFEMIPKNTSVILRRVPVHYDRMKEEMSKIKSDLSISELSQIGNLASVDAPEEDKLKAIMTQSESISQGPPSISKPLKIPMCFHCKQTGHVIRNCPLILRNSNNTVMEPVHVFLKTSLGIYSGSPKNAVMTDTPGGGGGGEEKEEDYSVLPDYLTCSLCAHCLNDAVLVPCCGSSYCQECIQNYLIDNSFKCPYCQKSVSPDDLIPNVSLRKSVANYHAGKPGKSGLSNTGGKPDKKKANENKAEDVVVTTEVKSEEEDCDNVASAAAAVSVEQLSQKDAPPVTCAVVSMPNIASSLMSSFPLHSMALATSSLLMSPFFGAINPFRTLSADITLPQQSHLKMVKVSAPFITTPYAKSVISGERILSRDEFYSLRQYLAERGSRYSSNTPGPPSSSSSYRRKGGDQDYHSVRRRRSSSRSRQNPSNSSQAGRRSSGGGGDGVTRDLSSRHSSCDSRSSGSGLKSRRDGGSHRQEMQQHQKKSTEFTYEPIDINVHENLSLDPLRSEPPPSCKPEPSNPPRNQKVGRPISSSSTRSGDASETRSRNHHHHSGHNHRDTSTTYTGRGRESTQDRSRHSERYRRRSSGSSDSSRGSRYDRTKDTRRKRDNRGRT